MAAFKTILRQPAPRAAVCWLAARYIRLIRRLGRWRIEGTGHPEALIDAKRPFLVAFWHGRLLMMSEAWPWSAPFAMVISQHADGELIARTIATLGFETLGGSSSRGASAVLRATLKSLKQGISVGITPDGPRGPRMHASPGIVYAASRAGVPILPVVYSARPAKLLGSWDRFMVPLPFCRGVIRWGEPMEVPRDIGNDAIQQYTRQLEERMNAMLHAVDEETGAEIVEPASPSQDPS
jgi:hypothetical protein